MKGAVQNGARRSRAQDDALRESEARFRTLAECAPVVVWMTDASNNVTYISRYWLEYTGRDPGADLGKKWMEAFHPDDRQRATRDLIEAAASGQPCRGEYRVKRADGEYGWLCGYGVPHFHADGSYAGHIGTCMDITEHKNREKAGFKVKDHLLLGQEAERRRVARELHDDISQRLALIGIELDEIDPVLPTGSLDLSARLKAVRRHVESIASDVHRISHNLHPSTVVHLGLVPALRRLCREFSEQKHIAVDFVDDAVPLHLPEDVALALFRVTQECLGNVAKHSGSREARVSLVERSGELHLTIADAGIGFDVDRLPTAAGLGLVSIRERARMIGAVVEIRSAWSQGTVVELRLPYSALAV
jgi:PAS domain S-box-containing protein